MQRAVILPSLCWSRRHPDFYAVTSGVTAVGIAFRSATIPTQGDRLTCSIRYVGSIEVKVVAAGIKTFTVKPTGSRRSNADLVRTLVDLAQKQEGTPGQRVRPRIVPSQVELSVTMEDGRILWGRIVNVSASGAAVHLVTPIAAGSRIRLGSTDAVVVRTYDNGVGASFCTPFDPVVVNASLVL